VINELKTAERENIGNRISKKSRSWGKRTAEEQQKTMCARHVFFMKTDVYRKNRKNGENIPSRYFEKTISCWLCWKHNAEDDFRHRI